jgi:AcrR family transcriptional regulator
MDPKATDGAGAAPATRDRILAAARELFAAHGFKGTTTAAIARQARVNEALIFRHFPAKRDLYAAILRAKLEDEKLAGILEAAGCREIPPDEALRLVGRRFIESADPVFLRLYYHSALEGHALAAEFYDHFVRRLLALVEELIRRGVREGRFRDRDPAIAAQAFTGMLRSYCLTRELFPHHALPTEDAKVADAFCDLFLEGLRKIDPSPTRLETAPHSECAEKKSPRDRRDGG